MTSLARRGQSLGVEGLPGVGKTSLLLHFFQKEKAAENGTVPFYFDVLKTTTAEELLANINLPLAAEPLTARKKVVFLFDNCETNTLLKEEKIVSNLQELKQKHNGHLSFFFCGTTLPTELLKLASGLNLVLKTFNTYQHHELLKIWLKDALFAVTKFQAEELFLLCGGHPGLTVTVLELAQRQIKSIRWEEFKEGLSTQPEIKSYCAKIWSSLRKNQKAALRTFVGGDYQKNQEILSDLDELERRGYFRKSNGQWQLFSKLFEDFIHKNEETNIPQGLYLEEKSGRAFKDGQEITALLTSTDFFLLTLFAKAANKVIKRESLCRELARHKGTSNFSDEALDQLVVRLRSKIEKDRNNPQHLLTLRGRGFQFIP
jgi:DNA-binding winged helix-turn-helix (wHTH) protein